MAKAPMIGIQDCVNFKLIAPKRGKLQMTQLYSAYTKSSLSSIPLNVEVILLKGNKINSSLLNNYPTKSTNHLHLKPKSLENNKETFIKNSLSLSSKGYGNGFTSNLNRFDNKKSLNDQYSPGPGEYNEHSLMNAKLRFRYNSLYANTNSHPLRRKKQNRLGETSPGPGFYDLSSWFSQTQDYTTLSPSFMSKRMRFKDFKLEKLGPGYYNGHKQSKWNSKMPSPIFREVPMKDITHFPEKYISITDRRPKEYKIKERFKGKNPKKAQQASLLSSSLFYSNSQDAFLISPKLKELNKILKEEQMIKSNSLLFNKRRTNYSPINNNDNWSKDIRSPFLSTSKRSTIFDGSRLHNPGPCYYQHKSK